MSKHYALNAEVREQAGKGVARSLRRENKVPAVIYGDNKEPVRIALSAKDITLEYRKGQMFTTLCDLNVDGKAQQVLARDVQLDPVTDAVLHADFLRVNAKTKIKVHVPLNFINEEQSPGIKAKGILNVAYYNLNVECLATSIPESIDVDLSRYKMGESVKFSDLTLPKGVKMADRGRHDLTLAAINKPRGWVEEVEESAEGEATAA